MAKGKYQEWLTTDGLLLLEGWARDGLTDEQKRKYRLLANKTGEKTGWDFDLLDWNLEGLDFEGYDFGFLLYTGC